MLVSDIIAAIEEYAPLSLQESYDNSGLQVGDRAQVVTAVLLCTDVTEEIIGEAVARGANLIISHHPLLFHGLKHLTGRNPIERIVRAAVKRDIAIYSSHTSMDNATGGVSFKMAEKIGLGNVSVMLPQPGQLYKLVVFVPIKEAARVRDAMFAAGAGRLGDYDSCSYALEGKGSFRALAGAHPWVGSIDELHHEDEMRLEVLVMRNCKDAVVQAMLRSHPYEEPAYDLIELDNPSKYTGSGVVGDTQQPIEAAEFLNSLKTAFGTAMVRYAGNIHQMISRVALCGGAGADFIGDAVAAHADIYVTGDVKYHEFTSYCDKILIADIGHYESEHFTKEIFYDIIQKKFPNFATYYAELEKNPINYL